MLNAIRRFRLLRAALIGPRVGQWQPAEWHENEVRCRRLVANGDYEWRLATTEEAEELSMYQASSL